MFNSAVFRFCLINMLIVFVSKALAVNLLNGRGTGVVLQSLSDYGQAIQTLGQSRVMLPSLSSSSSLPVV
ncbi:hypothetical protein [Zhongshania aquimaris]|uniref:Uncharacterized protein n=1 Tax=Zhongshania aquimaris TaxID=2857107 RepID=A0ABS6VPX5_9GAMM|nr:hypothetical protein [Zhongshania aquimaris]MBW2940367.1 hypothetical protein [Zhongshania aquimaris]